MFEFTFTSYGSIPTLKITVTDRSRQITGYLTPYRAYGFQVCIDLNGTAARGIIVGNIADVTDAAGGYSDEVYAALAYAGMSEWLSANNIKSAPNFNWFYRRLIYSSTDKNDELNWAATQLWLLAVKDWISTRKFVPGDDKPVNLDEARAYLEKRHFEEIEAAINA